MKNKLFLLLTGLMLAGLSTGCINLKPSEDPTRFYLLSTLEPSSSLASKPEITEELLLAIGVVALPSYMKVPWIMVRKGDNELIHSEFHQWAEAVNDGVVRAMAQNLSHLLNTSDISIMQRLLPDESRYYITVDLLQFEITSQGEVLILANWRVKNPGSDTPISGQFKHSRNIAYNPKDHGEAVAALSKNLADLSRTIADAISK